MCGIAGWLGKVSDHEAVAHRMMQRLYHRGPDGQSIRSWSQATLIHTRLSILDLSFTGAQPMCNEDGTIWVSFNGEIYNHHELRNHLEKKMHTFRGRSDTEVIPHLYEEEGPACVNRLRGMFALAIYDSRARRLVLARDRFGIKPLFYVPSSEYLAFASEIPTLLDLPDVDDRPDPQAIYDLAALRYIPAPETFYKGIRALEPGRLLEANLNGSSMTWEIHPYHRWSVELQPHMTLAQAAEKTDDLLSQAVQRQIESDVPWGTFLSGGIDSSLISGAAQETFDGQVPTFSVRFTDEDYDESQMARAVANHIGSRHRLLEMQNSSGTWDYITGLLAHIGQPFADTSLFGVNMMARCIREYVTVGLAGDGGDEGFGGYDRYCRLGRIAQLRRLPESLWNALWHGSSLLLTPLAYCRFMNSHPKRKRALAQAGDNTSIIQFLFCEVSDDEIRELCPDIDALPVRRLFESSWDHHLPSDTSIADRLFLHATEVDVRMKLPNDQLFKVDIASMKEGLEVRVPMLDEKLFEFALALPWQLKVKGKTGKVVLREIAKGKFPVHVANKPKQGFSVPVDTWVTNSFKETLRSVLSESGNSLSQIFAPNVYRPMIAAFCENRSYPGLSRMGLYRRAMLLLSVHVALNRKSASA